MQADEYQKLAARTRCPQEQALVRLAEGRFCAPRHEEISNADGPPPRRDGGAMLLHALTGITGELGELATAVEKFAWYGQDFDRNNVLKELGDLLWYLAEACDALDIPMSQVMQMNIEKLRVRFPEKFEEHLAREENRNRAAEGDMVAGRALDDGPNYDAHNE